MDVEILILSFIYLLVFPGFFFLSSMALFVEYFDRKIHAKMQKRVGPPLAQPLWDFIKLMAKEDIVPAAADKVVYSAVPIVAFASVITAFLYVPTFFPETLLSFNGDLVMVLFLLTIPSFAMFVAGYSSSNFFGQVGGVRALTQLFSYEVPFLLALLAPAVAVGSWGMSAIVEWQIDKIWLFFIAPLAFAIGLITLQGKIARIPFDIPEAETEIVDGPLADYSGRRLALFRFAMGMELVVGSALITALFLGGPTIPGLELHKVGGLIMGYHIIGYAIGFFIFLVKTLFIVLISTFIRTAMARIKIDQMVNLCYRYLAPVAIIQLMAIAVIKYMGWI